MKPRIDSLAIVTATTDPRRAADCFRSWLGRSTYHLPVTAVWDYFPEADKHLTAAQLKVQTRVLLDSFAPGVRIHSHQAAGVVSAFATGVRSAFADGAEAVLCLHDDLLIEEDGWDQRVLTYLTNVGYNDAYFGFGGGTGLGADDIYQTEYNPMQLARQGFWSNMRDAEAHGQRAVHPRRVSCFDGFSAGGTADWFEKAWTELEGLGLKHHAYDGALGCLAREFNAFGILLPIACHHFGGRTAVADQNYHAWAKTQPEGSDAGFWEKSHRIVYERFRSVLPLRVGK